MYGRLSLGPHARRLALGPRSRPALAGRRRRPPVDDPLLPPLRVAPADGGGADRARAAHPGRGLVDGEPPRPHLDLVPPLRRGLSRVSPLRWLTEHRGARTPGNAASIVAQASFALAARKMGALVVISR